MKIFIIGRYHPQRIISGPDKFPRTLYSYLLNNKIIEIKFISFFFLNIPESSLYNRLFGYDSFKNDSNVIKLGIFRLFLFLYKEAPDIVHITSGERFSIFVCVYKIFLKYRLVSTLHGISNIELRKASFLIKIKGLLFEKLALMYSDVVTVVSKMLSVSIEKHYNLRSKICVIPNGVDMEYSFNISREFNLDNELNFVFYNGTDKIITRGFDFVYNILGKLPYKNINIHIIGVEVEDQHSQSNITIINNGYLTKCQLISFWQNKHFFIKSPEYDSFPIMVLEAMATGTIPIISDNVGVKEYIKNGLNGFVYSQDYPETLLEILMSINSDKYNLNKISFEASKIKSILSWEIVLPYYLNLYNKIVET